MSKIADLRAFEILDSRGFPTVAVELTLESGVVGGASVPSGASTGAREAHELRDGDSARYGGKGVLEAVAAVNTEVRESLLGRDSLEQRAVDSTLIELDGKPDKSRLGANALLATSLAAARAGAVELKMPLYRYLARVDDSDHSFSMPTPLLNVLNGGSHADNNVDLQEFMILPLAQNSFAEALRCGAEVYRQLGALLKSRGLSTAVGDEGGFAPDLPSNEAALEALLEAIEKAGYVAGEQVGLALDCAASELLREDGSYHLAGEGRSFNSEEFADYLCQLRANYPIVSIEDGMGEEDWDGWQLLTERLGANTQLIGDDLFVTHVELLERGIACAAANAILIKPNQVGTLSETLDAIHCAKAAHFACAVSHRSGETEDTTIADLAVAVQAGQIKAGAPCRSERVAKYNRLLRIEAELRGQARYQGGASLAGFPGRGE